MPRADSPSSKTGYGTMIRFSTPAFSQSLNAARVFVLPVFGMLLDAVRVHAVIGYAVPVWHGEASVVVLVGAGGLRGVA